MHQYIPNTTDDQQEMLKTLGVDSFEELLTLIPKAIRFKDDLPLPGVISEMEQKAEVQRLNAGSANTTSHISFMGAGSYDHYIPQIVDFLVSRSEFYTAYTPYQPEVSQGTLQAMFEYQSMICELTGMDISNASLYDGASALAEACLLAVRHTGKSRILFSDTINPIYRQVARTYGQALDIQYEDVSTANRYFDVHQLEAMDLENVAAVVVQIPNFYGSIEDLTELKSMLGENGPLCIAVANPMSLGLLKSPGELGANRSVVRHPFKFRWTLFGFYGC